MLLIGQHFGIRSHIFPDRHFKFSLYVRKRACKTFTFEKFWIHGYAKELSLFTCPKDLRSFRRFKKPSAILTMTHVIGKYVVHNQFRSLRATNFKSAAFKAFDTTYSHETKIAIY